jgi:hypothetical protein
LTDMFENSNPKSRLLARIESMSDEEVTKLLESLNKPSK